MTKDLHFTLTRTQRKKLEQWLDSQPTRPDIFTVAFTVSPRGVQIKAMVDSQETLVEQGYYAEKPDECYLWLTEDTSFNLTPGNEYQNVKMWVSSEGCWLDGNYTSRRSDPIAYAGLRDDPTRALIPFTVDQSPCVLETHPLSLLKRHERMEPQELGWIEDYLRLHRNALEDHWRGHVLTSGVITRMIAVEEALPDGEDRPFTPAHWQAVERLNTVLMAAEKQARVELEQFERDVARNDNDDFSRDIDFELVCWLREDDPDWSEETNNIVYQNPRISVIEELPLEEDWNSFRGWTTDPLNGMPCCYFMHDLIDHGYLNTRDLLRIGSISLHVREIRMYEYDVPK